MKFYRLTLSVALMALSVMSVTAQTRQYKRVNNSRSTQSTKITREDLSGAIKKCNTQVTVVEPIVKSVKVSVQDDKVYEAVEEQAQFPDGQAGLNEFMCRNLMYPELAQQNNVEGRVIVQFIIEKDGSVSNPVIARGVDKLLDKEAIRIVKMMPKWQPATCNGEPVRSKFTWPVIFKLQRQ